MIYNLGSINVDFCYQVPNLPVPGETLHATGFASGLGGKGANQSVAAARAGATVYHIGAVGTDGDQVIAQLAESGVDVSQITRVSGPTGHAIIMVDGAGENAIVVCAGANMRQDFDKLHAALMQARLGDWLLLQNETSHQVEAARMAHAQGIKVAYSAAPFCADAARAVLPFTEVLLLNAVEAQQLSDALAMPVNALPVPYVVVTKGAQGATWMDIAQRTAVDIPAFEVASVDTTGAGDTFAGYMVAGLDARLSPTLALTRASAAAALSTTRHGTSQAIPDRLQVDAFLGNAASAPR